MMRPLLRIPLSTLLACVIVLTVPRDAAASQAPAAPEDFVLIVNPANPVTTLRRADASKLFLRKQTTWPTGQLVQPVNQLELSQVRRTFSDAIHGMDVASVKSYWQEIVFSGRGEPPPERASDADVISYVVAHPNAIGYIARTTPATAVKIVALTR